MKGRLPWWHKSKIDRKTRRIEFCPVSLGKNESTHEGYLIDISEGGAKIRLHHGDNAELISHDEYNLGIKTPYGASTCKVKLLWAEKHEDGDRIGVEFLDLDKDEKNPIRCLIDSLIS